MFANAPAIRPMLYGDHGAAAMAFSAQCMASACCPHRARPGQMHRSQPELRIEFYRCPKSSEGFVLSSKTFQHARTQVMPHLAQRILVHDARQLQKGFIGAADGQEPKTRVPLTQVR